MQQMRAAGLGGGGGREGTRGVWRGRGTPGTGRGDRAPPSHRARGRPEPGVPGGGAREGAMPGGAVRGPGVRERFGGGVASECVHGFCWGEDWGVPRSGFFFVRVCVRVRCWFCDEF